MPWDYDPIPAEIPPIGATAPGESPIGDARRPSFGPPWLPISLFLGYLSYLAATWLGWWRD